MRQPAPIVRRGSHPHRGGTSWLLCAGILLGIPAGPGMAAAGDEALAAMVKAELVRNRTTDHAVVEVTADEGVVRLTGEAVSGHQKRKASEVAMRVPSVRWVDNQLRVRAE